jgi:hypothetical protein
LRNGSACDRLLPQILEAQQQFELSVKMDLVAAYHPATMLKIYVYGYINQVQHHLDVARRFALQPPARLG